VIQSLSAYDSNHGSAPLVVEQPILIVARKDFPPKDLQEFVAYVKANAEKLNMAHAGVGSNVFNFGLVLNSVLGVRPTMVPFGGAGPAVNALVGGQVDYMSAAIARPGLGRISGAASSLGAVQAAVQVLRDGHSKLEPLRRSIEAEQQIAVTGRGVSKSLQYHLGQAVEVLLDS
jgi:hypothetical protein